MPAPWRDLCRPHGGARIAPAADAGFAPDADPTGMEPDQKMNFAARAGRWSAQHRKKAILGWLAFVLVATVIGGALGTKTFVWQDNGPGEAGRAEKTIYHAFPKHAAENVLIQPRNADSVGAARGSGRPADIPAFRAAVKDVET